MIPSGMPQCLWGPAERASALAGTIFLSLLTCLIISLLRRINPSPEPRSALLPRWREVASQCSIKCLPHGVSSSLFFPNSREYKPRQR